MHSFHVKLMRSTHEEMERRLSRMQLLRPQRLHAVHVGMQLRATCLLMRM
jgi:hypothetical protein